MISHRFPFVKNFFQVFSNFLKLFHSPGPLCFTTEASLRAAAALVSDLISLPRASGFVKNFFQIFQSFLFPLQPSPGRSCCCRPFQGTVPRALAYISKREAACQHFFSVFSSFFLLFSQATRYVFLSALLIQDMPPIFSLLFPSPSKPRTGGSAARRPDRLHRAKHRFFRGRVPPEKMPRRSPRRVLPPL